MPSRGSVKLRKELWDYFSFLYVIYKIRNRTEVKDIVYALHLYLFIYFNGLSLRNTSKALSKFITRSHTAIRERLDPKV
jgi:hypothetical protein